MGKGWDWIVGAGKDIGGFVEDTWNDLSGGTARKGAKKDRKLAAEERALREATWDDLYSNMPSANALTPDVTYADYAGDAETSAAGWAADPDSIAAQKQGLESLYGTADDFRGIYESGGMDAITKAENAMMRRDYDAQARAQREAAIQDMYARGMGGSGAQMAAGLQAGQSAADASYLGSLQNLAAGQARAQDALGQAGQLYGRYGDQAARMRDQSFGEDARRGSQIDAFNMYNTQARQGFNNRRADTFNQWSQGRAAAEQQAYDNRLNAGRVRTNQAQQTAENARNRQQGWADRSAQGAAATANAAATILSGGEYKGYGSGGYGT